jgi:hypothetical protein
MDPRPAVPPGPIVTLSYRVAPERREELLRFLRGAAPFYEQPGGVRVALWESVDEPGTFLELVAYATEAAYAKDQDRVEHDPEMKAVLGRFRALVDDGPLARIEVKRMRPVPID